MDVDRSFFYLVSIALVISTSVYQYSQALRREVRLCRTKMVSLFYPDLFRTDKTPLCRSLWSPDFLLWSCQNDIQLARHAE